MLTHETDYSDVPVYAFDFKSRRICLIEVPGLGNPGNIDRIHLEQLAYFLEILHERKVQLSGIIHLIDNADPRHRESVSKIFKLLKKLCSKIRPIYVALVTSRYSKIMAAEEETGVDELKMILEIWSNRCRVDFYEYSRESAIAAVESFLETHNPVIGPPDILNTAFRNLQRAIQGVITASMVSRSQISRA